MHHARLLLYRLKNLWRRHAQEADLDAELQFHIDTEAEEQIAAGLPADSARQAARRSLGNITLAKEDARAVWSLGPVERLLQDLRYAVRVLGRQPSFTATAFATIVLIVGGTTAVFTLVNAVLLRPLPYPASDRLVILRAENPRGGTGLSYPDVQRLQGELAGFEAWGLYRGPGYVSTLDRNSDNPLPVQDMRITPELFPLLGIHVVLGRPLTPDDALDRNPDVAVIGHDLWQGRFGGTPDVLGKSFELRPGRTVTVVGVAAPGADVPGNWISHPIVWHPIRMAERASDLRFTVLARLKAGRPVSTANAEIAARPPLTDQKGGADRPVQARLLLDHIVGESGRVLWVFFGAVTCVLLIGVANLVSLQLVRNTARERELGVRAALGASRWRLIRQLLVESLLLSVAGGAAGLLAASYAVALVTSALPADFPRTDGIAIDSVVSIFAALVSALVGVTMGVIPALRSMQPGLMKRLNEGAWTATLSRRRAWIGRGLVAFETAAALVLLVGAGLLVNSFGRLIAEDAGMRERDLWVVRGTLPLRYHPPADTEFWSSAVRLFREWPDVESAALAVNDGGPLDGGDILRSGIVPEGQTAAQGGGFSLSHRRVGGGYFSTLGIPIVSGRPIFDSDTAGAEGVVVLNRAAAAALWPGEDPLGRRLRGFTRPLRVVGIVPNFKLTRLDEDVSLQMYTSMQQEQGMPAGASAIMLRTKPGTRAMADRAKAVLLNLEKDLSRPEVLTMAQVRWNLLAAERFRTAVLLVFAGTATLLALVGIFGLVSYTVAQRHHEIGVRVALGATSTRIVSLMLRQALVPAVVGIVAGTAGALALSRLIAAFLFGVPATDPATFSAAIGLFFCAAFLAALVPALRSFRIEPAVALRHE